MIDKGKLLLLEEKSALMRRLGHKQLVVRFVSKVDALPAGITGTLSPDNLEMQFVERAGTQTSAQVLSALFAAGLPVADVAMQPAKLEDIMLRVLKGEGSAP